MNYPVRTVAAISTHFVPHQDEPLRGDHEEESVEETAVRDEDGLTADILASRYQRDITTDKW